MCPIDFKFLLVQEMKKDDYYKGIKGRGKGKYKF